MKKILLLTTAILFTTACNEASKKDESAQTAQEQNATKRQISKQEIQSFAFQKYKVDFTKLDKEKKQRIVNEYLYLSKLSRKLLAKGMKQDPDLNVAMKLLTVSTWERKAFRGMSVSEENLKKMYDKLKPTIADRYRMSNILVKTKEEATVIEAKLSKISDTLEKQMAFTKYVASDSLDERSKAKKGDLGWMDMKEVSQPMKAQFQDKKVNDILMLEAKNSGWHVIRITDYKKGHAATFEESKQTLEQMAKRDALNRKMQALVKEK
jgi:hypothetical protein